MYDGTFPILLVQKGDMLGQTIANWFLIVQSYQMINKMGWWAHLETNHECIGTVQSRYNTSQYSPKYSQQTPNSSPVKASYWVSFVSQSLIYRPTYSFQCCMQCCVILNRAITASDCTTLFPDQLGLFDAPGSVGSKEQPRSLSMVPGTSQQLWYQRTSRVNVNLSIA